MLIYNGSPIRSCVKFFILNRARANIFEHGYSQLLLLLLLLLSEYVLFLSIILQIIKLVNSFIMTLKCNK